MNTSETDLDDSRSSRLVLSHQVIRLLLFGLVVCVGVAAGVYMGVALTSQSETPEAVSLVRNQTFLDVGDRFPDYTLADVELRETTSVRQIIADRPCVLLFMSPTCDMCDLLKGYWVKKVEPDLRSDIQIACVYDVAEWVEHGSMNDANRLARARTFTTDRSLQKKEDGIDAMPTLLALDREGKIKLVVSGFDRNVGADMLNRVL